jgi:serine/threonine protein kinase/tetratricopeptide (TPR) repeat protein
MGLRLAGEQPPTAALPAAAEQAGDRIGRYKLLEKIGEGGCGVVYMAEQSEPVRRRVALKVIKLGMDTRQVVARFEAERQALALMDHPNIAKVLDGGATETGRPYFVMELVKGIKITDYCDQNNLRPAERLRLFTQVCQAIQHAHQKGVIHRDIKPSNILVTLHDGVPVPKVIDFGISKATEQPLTDKTLFTAFNQFIGTPAYMSPEQAELSGLDIDTRSDIYSLGVLLYELLTGKTPFDTKDLLAAGLDEMRRTIREKEPARPSTKLSTMAEGELTTMARHRQCEAPKLIALLRGDLDWIVMRALEKDRARRYETANGLAMDVQRYLADEPVIARPPSRVYQARKLLRRHRLAFAAAGAVVTALVIGLGLSTWLFFKERSALGRATKAEAKSQADAAKSEQVADFLTDMLKGVGPSVALGRDTTLLKEIMGKVAQRVTRVLINQPVVAAELYFTLGATYRDLGDPTNAEPMLREAVRLQTSASGTNSEALARTLNSLGNVLQDRADLPGAEALYRQAWAIVGQGDWRTRAAILNDLGDVLADRGQFNEAEPFFREALALHETHGNQADADLASLLSNLALLRKERGDLDEAEKLLRRSLEVRRALFPEGHPDVALSLNNLGNLLRERNRRNEAEPLLREALATRKKVHGPEHDSVAVAMGNLALLLEEEGNLAEAEAMCRDSLTMFRRLSGDTNSFVAKTLSNLGRILSERGDLPGAESAFREAVELRKRQVGEKHFEVAVMLNNLGSVLRQRGSLEEAQSIHQAALDMNRELLGPVHSDIGLSLRYLALVRRDRGDLKGAEALLRESLSMNEKLVDKDHPYSMVTRTELAEVLHTLGAWAKAEPLWRELAEIHRQRRNLSGLEAALLSLAEDLSRQGKHAEAETAGREALASRHARLAPDDDRVLAAASGLGRVLSEWSWSEREAAARTNATARAAEAEQLLRDSLNARINALSPTDVRLAETQSRLGGALLAVGASNPSSNVQTQAARFAEAEALLLEGREGLRQSARISPQYKRDSVERLVRLYETWEASVPGTGKSAKAEEWRRKLDALDLEAPTK